MDALEAIRKRRSVRRYTDRPVSDEDLDEVLRLALLAPTGGMTQAWSIIVVRDAERRAALTELILRGAAEYFRIARPAAEAHPEEHAEWAAGTPPRSSDLPEGAGLDRGPARPAQRLPGRLARRLGARRRHRLGGLHVREPHGRGPRQGLGTVPTGFHWFVEDEFRALLEIPPEVEAPLVTPLGYPEEFPVGLPPALAKIRRPWRTLVPRRPARAPPGLRLGAWPLGRGAAALGRGALGHLAPPLHAPDFLLMTSARWANMCSMIVAVHVPRLPLLVALLQARRPLDAPVALGRRRGRHRSSGSAPRRRGRGVRPGLRVGEALVRRPRLDLVVPDPDASAEALERLLERLGATASRSSRSGSTGRRSMPAARCACTAGWGRSCAGCAPPSGGRRRPRRGGAVAVRRPAGRPRGAAARAARDRLRRRRRVPRPLPAGRLPLPPDLVAALHDLGLRTIGQIAALLPAAALDRLGFPGLRAWRLARGEPGRPRAARPPAPCAPPSASPSRWGAARRSRPPPACSWASWREPHADAGRPCGRSRCARGWRTAVVDPRHRAARGHRRPRAPRLAALPHLGAITGPVEGAVDRRGRLGRRRRPSAHRHGLPRRGAAGAGARGDPPGAGRPGARGDAARRGAQSPGHGSPSGAGP